MITVYQIKNPFSRDIIYVGSTNDYEFCQKRYKSLCPIPGLAQEIMEIRASGKEPIFEKVDEVPPLLAARYTTGLIHLRMEQGARLYNTRKRMKKPIMEINLESTYKVTVHLPKSIHANPVFKEIAGKEDLNNLGPYLTSLIMRDLDERNGAQLDDWYRWTNE